jgi:hypothetical protein
MPEEQKGKLRLEIAHVLFIDIVGYSKLLISEQSELLEQLKEMVRKSPEAQTADSEGKLIRLATGEVRVRAAFEAARAQQEKIVQAQPDYGPTLCVLAMIDAVLGNKDLALEKGRRAIALMPLEKDVSNGSRVLQYSPLRRRGQVTRTLPCSNWKLGSALPSLLSPSPTAPLNSCPSGTRSAATRASKRSLPHLLPNSTHSARNAIIGSTRLALRAGTQQARSAIPNKSKATHMKVIGSEALTP